MGWRGERGEAQSKHRSSPPAPLHGWTLPLPSSSFLASSKLSQQGLGEARAATKRPEPAVGQNCRISGE